MSDMSGLCAGLPRRGQLSVVEEVAAVGGCLRWRREGSSGAPGDPWAVPRAQTQPVVFVNTVKLIAGS